MLGILIHLLSKLHEIWYNVRFYTVNYLNGTLFFFAYIKIIILYRIQSHLSESIDEVKWVSELFPSSKHYTGVYEDTGLLNGKTILAHGVHLNDDELNMLRCTGGGISHCPNSNCSLKSGFCNVLRLRDYGVKVGLGTDCAGGYSPSMIDSMR